MNDVRTPNNPGQNTHPSSASPLEPSELLAELRAFQRDFERALPRLRAAADRIEAKLRAGGLGGAVMAEPQGPLAAPPPPFAVLSDGRTLLSTDALADHNLGQREEWTGIVLSASDVAFVMGRLDNAAHETACHLVTQYPRVSEQPSGSHDGENNGEDEENESEDNEDGENE